MSNSEASVAKTNVLAIVSLVTSILGLGLYGVGLVGIVTGHIGLSQIKKRGEQGRGLAIAGLVIGYLSSLFFLLLIAYGISVGYSPNFG